MTTKIMRLIMFPYTVHYPTIGYFTQSCSGFGAGSSEQIARVVCNKMCWLASLILIY